MRWLWYFADEYQSNLNSRDNGIRYQANCPDQISLSMKISSWNEFFFSLNEEWSYLGIISKGVFGQRVMCRFLFKNSEMWNWSLIHVLLSPCPFIFVCQSENTISRSTCTSLNWTIILRVFLGCWLLLSIVFGYRSFYC